MTTHFRLSCVILLVLASSLEAHAQDTTKVARKLVSTISKNDRVEFAPTISADGRTMIFETQTKEKWELYQTTLTDAGTWSEPIPLTSINEKCNFIAGPSLSYDGNTLYYTAFIEGVTESEDIFFSDRLSATTWSEPKSVGAPVNTTNGYDGFPSVSADGNALYFIRINEDNNFDKKSKEPCFTVYVSRKDGAGAWAEPQVLPAPVNSGCERDPRIMADNHTLIFSSIREDGKGKYDLYQSQLLDNGTWSAVQPLSYVNSSDNDQSPCISASGNTMFYFSSNDIYEIPIPDEYRQMVNITVSGVVKEDKAGIGLPAAITVKDISSGAQFSNESNESDGRFAVVLRAGRQYEITFFNPSYVPFTQTLDFRASKTYREEKLNVVLSKSFTYRIAVEDKDLQHHTFRASLSLTGEVGQSLLDDSVSTSDVIPARLSVDENYRLTVAAKGYQPVNHEIMFRPVEARPEMDKAILIEHDKVEVKVDVTDISTGEKKRMKVTYTNQSADEVVVADAGETVRLRKGDRYQVIANSEKGYAYAMQTFIAGEGGEGQMSLSLAVAPLIEGAKLTLNHIYFDSNSASLSESSSLELSSLIELLQKNGQIVIEISAHTDDIGPDAYNMALSQKRAASVTDYLVKKGIPMPQLVARGYGETKPKVANDSEENRALNRRVELLVLRVQ